MRMPMGLFAAGFLGLGLIATALSCRVEPASTYAAEAATQAVSSARTRSGLQALYDFTSSSGRVVKDRSGVGEPLDLQIADPDSVRRSPGALQVRGDTVLRSGEPARKIIEAVRRSGELTIEAWVSPAEVNQSGPARIVTLSQDTGRRNFTLGQDGNKFDVRLRTSGTSTNGIPSLAAPSGSLTDRLTHVVYTRERSGRARIYVNNRRVAQATVSGSTSNWDRSFRLALANELTGDRPWRGTYHLVAVYSKALSASEIENNFSAGSLLAASRLLPQQARLRRGLEVFYDFSETGGSVVRDRSGSEHPLDLKIESESAVAWGDGSLQIQSPVLIASTRPARELSRAVKRSGGLTLEAWVRPAGRKQDGPARILSLSQNTVQRNFTLGQDGAKYDVRLRTTRTSENGIPSLNTPDGSLTNERTHVVYTFAPDGTARIYLNGKRRSDNKIEGKPSNWSDGFRLILANELTSDRPWLGELHLVAVYSRALSAQEVVQNFEAGANGTPLPPRTDGRRLFAENVAPVLAQRCLECHDSAAKKGELDLSRKQAALAGGASGKAVVPGKPDDSLLWQYVEIDQMPKDRPPLSAREKRLLRRWIEAGAVWSVESIDRTVYRRGGGDRSVWVRRLTVAEYIETVRAAVGVDIEKEAREILPPDLRADGFSNTAYNLNVDLKHVEAYAELARIIVDRMDVGAFAARFSKSRSLSTDDTMRQFVAAMGKWLLRGPLDEREVNDYSGIATTVASAGGDFEEAVGYIIQAMLQSPRFIYRIERQRGDGTPRPLDDYELASRLSYIIWGGPPDEELMRAADAGALSNRGKALAQVRRMLRDPRAVEQSLRFASQWLNLDRLDNLRPDPDRFPNWDERLADDMRQETLAFFRDVAWKQKRPLAQLLNAQVTYATPRLAEHYGLKPKSNNGQELSRYDLREVAGRGGLLTQGSVLTIGGDEASMVTRGLFVLHEILDGHVGDPPPGVDTTPVPTKPGLSQRAISEARIANKSCGGCHRQFEPFAFGLEKFDGLGTYHEKDEHGNTLRDDGEILLPGAGEPVAYESSAELMDLLAESERAGKTITRKLTQFALGRPLVPADVPVIEQIHESARKNGGTYQSLVTAIVMSDLVRKTRTEQGR